MSRKLRSLAQSSVVELLDNGVAVSSDDKTLTTGRELTEEPTGVTRTGEDDACLLV